MSEPFLLWVVAVLATVGIANTVATQDGPGDILRRMRQALGGEDYAEYRPRFGEAYARPRTSLGRLIRCPYCLSVWIALPISFALFGPLTVFAETPLFWVCVWWSIVGAQFFIQSHLVLPDHGD